MARERNRSGVSLTACAMVMAASLTGAAAGETDAVQRIESYCTTSWRNAGVPRDQWSDCTQQVFLELLKRVERDGMQPAIDDPRSDQRRELNRSIWCTVQRWRRAPRNAPLTADRHAETRNTDRRNAAAELNEVWDRIAQLVTPRQARILELAAEGRTVAEIAETLDTTAARISDEKYKAVQKLRRTLT